MRPDGWVGWYGFNAGSALASDGVAANAFTTTTLATAIAASIWPLLEWLTRGKPTVLGFCSGAVAGLVVITPGAGLVAPWRSSTTTTRWTHSACTAWAARWARWSPASSPRLTSTLERGLEAALTEDPRPKAHKKFEASILESYRLRA